MAFDQLKKELYDFYLVGDVDRAEAFAKHCFAKMDARAWEGMSVEDAKCLQYDVITEEFSPVIFPHAPFFFETGVLTSLSDGARNAKGHGFLQANGWTYARNSHLFREQDEMLYERKRAQSKEILYLICGAYNDDSQHFNFNVRPILKEGLRGICARAEERKKTANTPAEHAFLDAVCHGMHALRRMAQTFAAAAENMLPTAPDGEAAQNLTRIADTAARVPWNAPRNFYEALATVAFLRTAFGSLEGVGPNTFGRLDVDLYPFFERDLQAGELTEEEAYTLICQFLLLWDCHYDHDMQMKGYADHELENTYTLGGCDEEGNPVYNRLTSLFLRANREQHIIFPKIVCRFSENSPKEYLEEILTPILAGTSTVLLENDDAMIASLVRAGRSLKEARDYYVTGCWGTVTAQEKYDHGNYLNLLKPFEYALHRREDKMELTGLRLSFLDDCRDFESLYEIVLKNSEELLGERIRITREGGQILHRVDVCPIFSSTLDDCIQNAAEYSAGGARYRDDYYLLFGLPNVVDSLLAIRELVFEQSVCTLSELLDAVRNNWEGCEELRRRALACHGWGDGSEEGSSLAARFQNDLYRIASKLRGGYGGRVNIGHLTYTEIRWWGEKTLATPDGRKNGEYFAQGLTPSRLKRIPFVTDVINSLAAIDPSTMAANSVVNLILPTNTTVEQADCLLRVAATTALQALQLNCTSREQLLDAQKHPENYPDLIVRVTGFSARFTSLSREWQDEVISRNFYEG